MYSFSHPFIYSVIKSTPKYTATPVLRILSGYTSAGGKQFDKFFLKGVFTLHSRLLNTKTKKQSKTRLKNTTVKYAPSVK